MDWSYSRKVGECLFGIPSPKTRLDLHVESFVVVKLYGVGKWQEARAGLRTAGFPLNTAVGTLQVDDARAAGWAAISMNEGLLFGSRTLSFLRRSGTFRAAFTPGLPGGLHRLTEDSSCT